MKRLLWLVAPLVLGGAVAKSDGFRLRDDVRGELRIGARGFVAPRSATAPTPPPLLRIAPASGAGMPTACSTTAPTTEDGGVLTLGARASVKSCLKHGEYDNIANGDLVKLAADKYAVMPGGDGSGALGINVEVLAGTNYQAGSEDLDGADWTPFGSGVGAPTVTANAGTAPDGTNTAERIQVPATGAGNTSIVYGSGCHTGTPTNYGLSCFVRGYSGSGTIQLDWGGGSGGWDKATCSYTSTAWKRCRLPRGNAVNATLFGIGFVQTASSGADALVWGCQCERDSIISSYMPTAIGATASRPAESVTFVTPAISSQTVSMSVTPVAPYSFSEDMVNAMTLVFNGGLSAMSIPILGSKAECEMNIAGVYTTLLARENNLDPVSQKAAACSHDGSTLRACYGASCKSMTDTSTIGTGTATLSLGYLSGNGTMKEICVADTVHGCDPSGVSDVTCPASVGESSTVALIGDSIIVGYTSSVPVATETSDRLCPLTRTSASFAVSGAKIASGSNNCTLQYTTSVQGHAYRAVATNCGINDILNGTSGHAAFTTYQTLLDQIRSDGFHIVAGTLTPCAGYSTCDTTQVTDFNSDLTTYAAAHPAQVTLVDNYTLLLNATEVSYAMPLTLGSQCLPSADALHPQTYCSVKLADSFADGAP